MALHALILAGSLTTGGAGGHESAIVLLALGFGLLALALLVAILSFVLDRPRTRRTRRRRSHDS